MTTDTSGESGAPAALDATALDAHIRAESARFAEVLREADPSAPVPTCPGWSAADLLRHLAEVHHFWAVIVRDRLENPAPAGDATPPRPDAYADLLAQYERTTEEMLHALAGAADDVAVWTWAAERTVGFVRRFQAHEALMHRVDAEVAVGTPSPLPADLAADGVTVVLTHALSWRPDGATWHPSGATARLHATDTGNTWTLALGTYSGTEEGEPYDGRPSLEPVADANGATPTVTVTGTAACLDGWLWSRPGYGEVMIDGPADAVDVLTRVVAAGVQ